MLPRGEQIFDLFFSQSILFAIFRDTYVWDANKYDIRCSNQMHSDEIFLETIKYGNSLFNLEKRLFDKISQNRMWRAYISFLGAWSVSESFVDGITKSINQFYRDKVIPDVIHSELSKLSENVKNLTSVFQAEFEENNLF